MARPRRSDAERGDHGNDGTIRGWDEHVVAAGTDRLLAPIPSRPDRRRADRSDR